MYPVKPKKSLGQHFLTDMEIAERIAGSLLPADGIQNVLEIGPGMGVLTQFLVKRKDMHLKLIEIDRESVIYLMKHFPSLEHNIISGDFLHHDLSGIFNSPFHIIGNFPYNISSQILFRMFENRMLVPQLVGMFQKEVAMRICSPPRKKDYGILSVLIQAFYETEYLFTVDEHVFNPPPKVKSGVVRLVRKENFSLGADEILFKRVVKTAFNQRRKTLRNALKPLLNDTIPGDLIFLPMRAEELSFRDFADLTNILFPPA
jgi:16S rRNA (adenine1518-N6/adenine1519-N6)-dimethyltransferase